MAADRTSFIAESQNAKEILKSANLLKSLHINVLIVGEDGTGKTSLARYIDSSASVIDSCKLIAVCESLDKNSTLIVKNFNQLTSFIEIQDILRSKNIRLIATAKNSINQEIYDMFFSISLYISNLEDRDADILPLAGLFLKQYKEDLKDDIEVNIKEIDLDISSNCHSLKRSVYKHCFYQNIDEEEIVQILEKLIYEKIGGKNDYRDLIYLFELPLFRAGFKKFHSQLKMSEKFGLNRNTIRKKIKDLGDML